RAEPVRGRGPPRGHRGADGAAHPAGRDPGRDAGAQGPHAGGHLVLPGAGLPAHRRPGRGRPLPGRARGQLRRPARAGRLPGLRPAHHPRQRRGQGADRGELVTRLGVWYDFRNPARWRLPWQQLYRETLDQAVHAEELGFDSIWLSEHHFTDEGYLPCLPAVLGTLAARTSRVRLGTAVLLAPLHHPLRLAEDLAVVDQLSGGRLDVGIAPGYKPDEFAVLGVPKAERGARTNETVEILRLAWAGERFSYAGKHFTFDDVIVAPPPVQPGGPPIWVGGSSLAAARRASRYGLCFMPDSGAGVE